MAEKNKITAHPETGATMPDAPRIIRSWWDLIFFKREKPWNDNPTSMALHDVNTETRDVSEGLATKHATTLVHVSPECGH